MTEFNQGRAWSIFEFYASGNFNEVADYLYSSAESFYQRSLDFVPKYKRNKYRKELEEEFNVKIPKEKY